MKRSRGGSSSWAARIRRWNPDIDSEFGPTLEITRGNAEEVTSADWDALANEMAGLTQSSTAGSSTDRKTSAIEDVHRGPEPRLQLVASRSESSRPSELSVVDAAQVSLFIIPLARPPLSLLAGAMFAGFFVFGVELAIPNVRQPSNRGVIAVELAGCSREAAADGSDHGGRIVLDNLSQLIIGKRALKTVARQYDPTSNGEQGGHRYHLVVSTDMHDVKEAWLRLAAHHGVDWLGFKRVSDIYLGIDSDRRVQQALPILHMISIVLITTSNVDASMNTAELETIVSEEVGYIVGECYTCVSLSADTEYFPRCDQVRAAASTLWLAQKFGIRFFDVGVSANNYIDLLGFRKTSRAEFVEGWRQHRQATAGGSNVVTRPDQVTADRLPLKLKCDDVRQLLQQHIHRTASSEHDSRTSSTTTHASESSEPTSAAKRTSKPVVRVLWKTPCMRPTEEGIRQALESFGSINRISFRRTRALASSGSESAAAAFVVFDSQASVESALSANITEVCGTPAVLDRIRP